MESEPGLAEASEHQVPPPPTEKVLERPHPATPLIRGWLILVAIVFGLGRELIPDGSSENGGLPALRWILLGIAAAVVVAVVIGFLSWRFTRFVIDTDEVRVETGMVFKQSKRIPFSRIQSIDIVQPLAARIFGLAELKIEAGAGDSGVSLRFLNRTKASRLRDYLLQRAHGRQIAPDTEGEAASAFTDLSTDDEMLVRLTPQQLVLGWFASLDLLIPILSLIVVLIVTQTISYFANGGPSMTVLLGTLPVIIPLGIGLFTSLSRFVLAQFNYTLARSERGLRIARGLTNLASQSIPLDRIQGVSISQPFTWRPLGFHRVHLDILGKGVSVDSSGQPNSTESVLLPVASAAQVQAALAEILPGVDLAAIKMVPASRSSRWLRWWDWWRLRHGFDERVIVSSGGWLFRSTSIVPHAKMQSVRITRGPLQRRLELATVHVDTTPGPVTLTIPHVTPERARELAIGQLARSAHARSLGSPGDSTRHRDAPPEALHTEGSHD